MRCPLSIASKRSQQSTSLAMLSRLRASQIQTRHQHRKSHCRIEPRESLSRPRSKVRTCPQSSNWCLNQRSKCLTASIRRRAVLILWWWTNSPGLISSAGSGLWAKAIRETSRTTKQSEKDRPWTLLHLTSLLCSIHPSVLTRAQLQLVPLRCNRLMGFNQKNRDSRVSWHPRALPLL